MSEKRFLTYFLVEGIMLLILGFCILVIPKLTSLSYGVMLSGAFITYGLFKIINSFVNRTSGLNLIYCLIMSITILTLGILILFVPKINLLWLVAVLGLYFIVDSISSAVYSYYLRNRFNYWGGKLVTSIVLFLVGLSILMGIPVMSFWMVTMLSGIVMIIKGTSKATLSLINIYSYKI